MPNSLAKYVLAEYLATPEPRYALLINAPWGAGKTEFVKKQTQYESNQNFLYMSLFGIDSAEAFNGALLGAIMRNPGNEFEKNARRWGETLKNIVSNSQAVGFSVNLSGFSLVDGLRKHLPKTLIFDDLERISMPQSAMSGLLNQFIEHEKRQVILIANTSQIKGDEREAFDTTREKGIGQSIKIFPDVEAALQSYWVSIPPGRGRDYLQENQDLIKTVFNQSGHENLRLLRYAMQAAANLLNKIDEELFHFTNPMKKLTSTFLALHMAYGGGRIGEVELDKRNDSRAFGVDLFGKSKPKEQIQALMDLEKAHPDCDIRVTHGGSPLPVDLAKTLLVKGFASKETINNHLRQTHFFAPPEDRPDWIKLWHWEELSVSELTDVLSRLTAQLSKNEVTNPGEFIQIYGALHWIARFGGLECSQEELSEVFLGYIQGLSKAGKIKPRLPSGSARDRYIFGHENGSVNYSGHVYETDAVSEKVVETLKGEMESKYIAGLANVASHLLGEFETSTKDFLAQIRFNLGSHNYATAPILQLMDKSRFANRLLYLIENDREVARQVADLIKARRQNHHADLSGEHVWIDAIVEEIQSRAAAKSRLFGAQVDLFIRREF